MFCNRCGTELDPALPNCPQCGRRLGDPVTAIARSRLQGHLHTLGVLWIVLGSLFLIPAAILLLFGGGMHLVLYRHEPLAEFIPLILYLIGSTLLILAAGGICVGLGLIQRRPWARIWAIVLGVLALFHPPFGTALGVYTLWVLLADENGHEYLDLTRAA
ncbi:MAG TPA: zinc ribbon domain-containing protein [Terriglobales bacterium]|nr:zinc ribbon domain-containing protein [Terriglobales bacterium]